MATMKPSKPSKPSKKLHHDTNPPVAGLNNLYKNVGFASSPVVGELRPPTHNEDWSLYYFESHVQSCEACYSPSKKTSGSQQHRDGRVLCKVGQGLARQVIALFYRHEGNTYSTLSTSGRMVRVEIPKRYKDCRNLLKTVERGAYPYTTISPHGHHHHHHDTLADKPYNIEERRPAPTKTRHTVKLHQDYAEAKPSKSAKAQAPAQIPAPTRFPLVYPLNERYPATPNTRHQHSPDRKHYHGQNIVDWPEHSERKTATPRVYVHNDNKENSRSRRKNDSNDDARSTCAVVGSRGYSFANKTRPLDSSEMPRPRPKGYNRQSHRHSLHSGYLTDLHCSRPCCTLGMREPLWDRHNSLWSTSYYI